MPLPSEFKQRAITLEIEDVMGVAQADTPASVLLVTDFTSQVYTGEDKEIEYASLENLSAAEIKKIAPQSIFGWKTPLTKPDAGVIPSWAKLFATCGFNQLDTGPSNPPQAQLIYTLSEPSEIDTATIREYQAADDMRNHHYVGTGATGNIGLDFVAGEIPEITVSNYLSNYVRPDMVAPFVADNALVNAEECKAGNVDGHILSQLDGKDICVQSLRMQNLDGRNIGRDEFFCQTYTGGSRGVIQLEVIYMNPDWQTEFNPWELGESHEQTNRVPFIFQHELGTVFVEEVQPINTEKVAFGDAGLKCIKQTLNVLKGLELRFDY